MTNTTIQNSGLSTTLVKWFAENKRDLPWRKTSNPYFIWISEVMLQQTQVETVIPYYERFITRFPTMYDLARVDEDVLLKEWEGLGYYSRARNLQAGVKEVVENYNAKVPSDKTELLKVKGIGPYTAGAILSIAFKQPVPAVDGNVMRVASRLFNIKGDITKIATKKEIEEKIAQYIPAEYASEFNQALMELGALICKPKSPKCNECPLSIYCMAFDKGIQESLPVKSKKVKQKKLFYHVVVLQNEKGLFYIQKRPDSGLLAGLWEFPMVPIANFDNELDDTVNYLSQNGFSVDVSMTNMSLTHTFSHLKWDLKVVFGTCHSIDLTDESGKWVTITELSKYPFSVAHQKVRTNIENIVSSF
jgi:A/G-specific adenine glycosylase